MGNTYSKISISSQLKNIEKQLQTAIYLNKALMSLQTIYKLRLFYTALCFYPLIYIYFRNSKILLYSIAYFIIIFVVNLLLDRFFDYRIRSSLKQIEDLEKKQTDLLKKIPEQKEMSDVIQLMEKSKRKEMLKKNLDKRNIILDKYELEKRVGGVDRFRESVIDLVIGEDPRMKFALICKECGTHNGLCLPENVKNKFECYFCAYMNNLPE
ncbi:Endoplasmic reticulum junction formation protein lunapark-B [Cucumispora dikerogammari]|nr:Endoplasmic reticulum junction formation protein lunapark-B [Cucumispora dikerogammari]